ncbi:GMP synthase - Glutamine amidotransferase [Streptosporangium subroseum]|uniref:GMP synthase - Glutamine amidotransferase n=1 Tax=Streptosporangium subroseum TaxID=106412 RepID=A0A239GNQ2_9ACTN|nr:type 1 glutamine amidotransferase [Streptosporangium subroseum]SNS69704.1 GMP synthase - Glutamine amidotransferase [Streptosporangium subroseum]
MRVDSRRKPRAVRMLAIQNAAGSGPARFGEWWGESGLEVDLVAAFAGAPVPERLEHDAIVVLGGGLRLDDDKRAPWLTPVMRLMKQAIENQVPSLGICLGGQMLAKVAGGALAGEVREQGSTAIHLRPAADEDPLFHALPEVVHAIQHHKHSITRLPPGAVWLAETEQCPYQAFRVGPRSWGLQFHPEIGPDRIRRWNAEPLCALGIDPAELYARAVCDEPASTSVWRKVALRFGALARRHTAAHEWGRTR